MTFSTASLASAAFALSLSLSAASPAQVAPPAPAASPTASIATIPKDRLDESWWAARHEAVLAQIKANPGVGLILVGDSITQNYEKNKLPDENFQPTWQQFYGPRNAINLGYSGDTTENVLWRLDHGEVDGIHPTVALVLIGTNNTGSHKESAQDTELGIDAVIQKLQEKLPKTKILLLAILPGGPTAQAVAANLEVNHYLAAKYGPATDDPNIRITYLDIAPVFFQNGKLNEALFYDPRLPQHGLPLHPDTIGQRLMAEAIEPTLTRMLNDSARQYLATLHQVNTAVIPVPRLERDSYDWYQRHRDELELQKTLNPQIVLIGDSITHFWGGEPKSAHINGPKSWEETFAGIPTLNMGFGWDRTQNVLWRLRQGEFDGIHPKIVVLNIGTNNLSATPNARSNTPEEIVEGILAIHREIRHKSPESRIIIMGIFPRGFSPASDFRAPILQVNALLSKALAGEPNTTFLDIGSQFLAPDGTLPTNIMGDGTHPTDPGYLIWSKALITAGLRQ